MPDYQTETMRLACNPESGCFDIFPLGSGREDLPQVEDAHMRVVYWRGNKRVEWLSRSWTPVSRYANHVEETAHGETELILLDVGADEAGLAAQITFGLPLAHPFVMWKIKVTNQGETPLRMEQMDLLRIGQARGGKKKGSVLFPGGGKAQNLAFYSHGWQSWSWTAAYGHDEAEKRSRLKWIQSPLFINAGTPQPRRAGDYAGDFFGVLGDRQRRAALWVGFLSQREQFGTVKVELNDEINLRVWANCDGVLLDPGESLETDWVMLLPLHVDCPEEAAVYFDAAARENGIGALKEIPAGWCSWYEFYQNISEEKIRANLTVIEAMKPRLPLGLVQIDDGFEHEVGDWLTFRAGFPDGVAGLAADISRAGCQAGLWLAPFIVHPRSDVYRDHPDWLLRQRNGRPVNAGFIWNVFTTALDLTHPQAQAYVREVVQTAVREWGFDYLKLDFLYAAVVKGGCYHDPKKTRAQVLRDALKLIREVAGPQTTLLACGCPIGSALGLFDAMRVGADVSGSWRPAYGGLDFLFREEPNMPSARNAIQNVLTRAPMHRRWFINDPDCLVVRERSQLSLAEVQSLAAVIGLSGGSLLLSDDLPALPVERLEIARMLLPTLRESMVVTDWFDRVSPERARVDLRGAAGEWLVAGVFNWSDQAKMVELQRSELACQPGRVLVRSFWDGKSWVSEADDALFRGRLEAHGCALLAVRPLEEAAPAYAGSSLHFSQGVEVQEWLVHEQSLSARLDLGRSLGGVVDLYLPGSMTSAEWNGQGLQAERMPGGVLRFSIPECDGGWLTVAWE